MYQYTHIDVRCSKCNALNNYETVTRGQFGNSETFKRCLSCGHESLQSTLRSSSSGPTYYKLPPQEKETKF